MPLGAGRRLLSGAARAAVLVVVVAACGGGDDGTASTASTPAGATSQSSSDAASTGSTGAGPEWCDTARELKALGDAMSATMFDPVALEHSSKAMIDAAQAAVPHAPAEIAADYELVVAGMARIHDGMAEVEYDLVNADLSGLQPGAEHEAASDRLDAYEERVCGIIRSDEDSEETSGDFDPAAGTPLEQMVATLIAVGFTEAEARCISGSVDFTNEAVRAGDPGVLGPIFEACGIDAARLKDITG